MTKAPAQTKYYANRESDKGFRVGFFCIAAALSVEGGFYQEITGGVPTDWTQFLASSLTITALLVSFSGVMYVSAMTSIKNWKKGLWDRDSTTLAPVNISDWSAGSVKLSEDQQVRIRNTLDRLTGTSHVQGFLEVPNDLSSLLTDELRYIFVAWSVNASASLFLLAVRTTAPASSVLFAIALFGLLFESMQFGLFGWRTTIVFSRDFIDSMVEISGIVLNKVKEEASQAKERKQQALQDLKESLARKQPALQELEERLDAKMISQAGYEVEKAKILAGALQGLEDGWDAEIITPAEYEVEKAKILAGGQ